MDGYMVVAQDTGQGGSLVVDLLTHAVQCEDEEVTSCGRKGRKVRSHLWNIREEGAVAGEVGEQAREICAHHQHALHVLVAQQACLHMEGCTLGP